MTVLIALRKVFDNKISVFYGTDGMISNSEGEKSVDICNSHKHVDFGHFVVLWNGTASVQGVLEAFKRRRKKKDTFWKMKNREDAQDFSAAVLKAVKKLYPKKETSDLEVGMIIITKKKFYIPEVFVEEKDNIAWGGTGGYYVSGLLLDRYDKVKTPKELKQLLLDALKLACRLRGDCGEPITIKEFK